MINQYEQTQNNKVNGTCTVIIWSGHKWFILKFTLGWTNLQMLQCPSAGCEAIPGFWIWFAGGLDPRWPHRCRPKRHLFLEMGIKPLMCLCADCPVGSGGGTEHALSSTSDHHDDTDVLLMASQQFLSRLYFGQCLYCKFKGWIFFKSI